MTMTRGLFLLCLALPLQPATSQYDRLPTQKKIDLIESKAVKPGSQIVFAEKELNTYLAAKAQQVVPEGLRDTKITLRDGMADGYAVVNFVKMRHAQGRDMGWLLNNLLDGEHPMKVTGRLQSADGNAKVDLERVEVGGVAIRGRALEMLIRTFVSPLYPQARVGQSFELGYNMERIELRAGQARVVIANDLSRRSAD
jgi:hypothetical protein